HPQDRERDSNGQRAQHRNAPPARDNFLQEVAELFWPHGLDHSCSFKVIPAACAAPILFPGSPTPGRRGKDCPTSGIRQIEFAVRATAAALTVADRYPRGG